MAIQPNYAGAALIKIDDGTGLASLGYTQDGAEISVKLYTIDVPGDQNGGTEGPPIDVQNLGQTAEIRLTLTKWDTAIADKIAARVAGGSAGIPYAAGAMFFNESKTYRLVVLTPTTPFNFPRVIFKDAVEINKGVKFSRFICTATAYADGTGTLFNATTS